MRRKVAHVILASGGGEAFWPLSTIEYPKQFLDLDGSGRTFLQSTYDRIRSAGGGIRTLYVQTPARLEELVRRQLPELPLDQILIEPVDRGTAARVALAVLEVRERLGDVVMAVFPAHHRVRKTQGFTDTLQVAVRLAGSTRGIVALGATAERLVSGRGYIECGAEVGRGYRVRRFLEGPGVGSAVPHPGAARVTCDTGNYVFHVGVMYDELVARIPDVVRPLELAHRTRSVHHRYARLPQRSFDREILHRTDKAFVVPAVFDWDDVADWSALERGGQDVLRNTVVGRHVGVETEGIIAYDHEAGGVIATLGVRDVVIVRRAGVVLLVAKERLQELKRLSDHPELNEVDLASSGLVMAVEA